MTQHLPLLDLDPELESQVKGWFQAHVDWMLASDAGRECAARDDNKPFWYNALVGRHPAHTQCHSRQLATHLSHLDPPRGEALGREYLDRVINLRPTPADFYAKTVIRADPRHSALFLLEPTFILAYVSRAQGRTLDYLHELLQYAKTIQPGVVDVNSDNDERYFRKLALFERILKFMQGGSLSDAPTMDGEGWEGGWGEFMAITWGL